MIVDFPQIDLIMHAKLDKMSFVQREYVEMLNSNIHFVNTTFLRLLDRISREYNYVSIIDLLSMVDMTLSQEEDECVATINFDDFVKNASIVSQSLKKILSSPSKKLVKIEKYVPAYKVTNYDSKTMTWLARRPGATMEEKMAPKNVIPTKVTYFTTDTKENRHTLYLYDILYDYLYEKVYPSDQTKKCDHCDNSEKECFKLYEKLKMILLLKHKVKVNNLNEVPKEKQIWDAVRDIDYFESNCKNIWKNLKQRYQFMIFLFVCSKLMNQKDVFIYDTFCQLLDEEGKLRLKNQDAVNRVRFHSMSLSKDIHIALRDDVIVVETNDFQSVTSEVSIKAVCFQTEFDLSTMFDHLKEIEIIECQLNELQSDLRQHQSSLKQMTIKLEDFYSKQEVFSNLIVLLDQRRREMVTYEQEEEEKKPRKLFKHRIK